MATLDTVLRAPWPTRWRVLAVLALYAAYLPLSGYVPGQVQFDAAEYWELSLKFTQQGHFSLLAYDEPLRGYLGPLLVLPARVLCHFTGWSMLVGAQVLGAGWAAVLFGVAIPEAWKVASGRPLPGGRWLGLLGLTFLFWRDYFNFPLTDMPSLTLLLLGLVALGRPGWAWAAAAGLLLAAAVNIRAIYVVSAPGWLWLLGGAPLALGPRWRRGAWLAAGVALVLLPQWLINRQHFQRNTPLVVGGPLTGRPIYLKQLAWGTKFQRYESSLVPEFPRSLVYADPAGHQALAGEPGGRFGSYEQYLRFAGRQPFTVSARYLRHLFNGLDVWFPTPYPTRLHPPGQTVLRLLNYALLGVGTWLAWGAVRRRGRLAGSGGLRRAAVPAFLLALLLPCLLVLPMLIECRYLLPLHLLLLTGVAAHWRPVAGWRALGGPARRTMAVVLGLLWVFGCWQLSEATARQLRPPAEAPQD